MASRECGQRRGDFSLCGSHPAKQIEERRPRPAENRLLLSTVANQELRIEKKGRVRQLQRCARDSENTKTDGTQAATFEASPPCNSLRWWPTLNGHEDTRVSPRAIGIRRDNSSRRESDAEDTCDRPDARSFDRNGASDVNGGSHTHSNRQPCVLQADHVFSRLPEHFAKSLLLFLENGRPDTFALRQRHQWLVRLPDHKHVGDARRERVSGVVFDVDDVERSLVPLLVLDPADPPDVLPARHHRHAPHLELDEVFDLPRLDVQQHRVVGLSRHTAAADPLTPRREW